MTLPRPLDAGGASTTLALPQLEWLPELSTEFWVTFGTWLLNAAIFVAALLIIPRNRRPTTALAWILTILLIPYLGIVLFFLFGTNQLSSSRRRRQADIDDIIRDATDELRPSETVPDHPAWFPMAVRLNETLTALPLIDDNAIDLHGSYNRTIERMTAEIDTATNYVHVLYYCMSYDNVTAPFFDALERAVKRGVTVRVLFDHVGSMRYSGYRKMRRRLREIGCAWHPALSLWPWEGGLQRVDLRNHRKIVVIDGHAAFIGSQNLIARDYHHKRKGDGVRLWKDLAARVEGPIAVAVDAVFLSDWFGETGEMLDQGAAIRALYESRRPSPETPTYSCQLVPSGPGYENENNLRLFNQLLYSASKHVVIVSPYFVPDDSLLYAITTAVQRGVRVELFVSEVGDQFFVYHAQRSYYDALLRAGVRIFLYRKPYILHSKHMTFDDEVTLIGSSNVDMRSFTLNAELMLMVHGNDFGRRMHEVENGYRQRSFELTLEDWRQRPILTRAFDNIARLTSVLQ